MKYNYIVLHYRVMINFSISDIEHSLKKEIGNSLENTVEKILLGEQYQDNTLERSPSRYYHSLEITLRQLLQSS